MIDLERIADEARKGVVPILKEVLAKGVSLYGGDGHGGLVEIAPDGHKYQIVLRDDRIVRIRELTPNSNHHSR